MTDRIGIDTRSILPRRRVSVPTISARDRIRVMEYRASKGDADAIAWMDSYREAYAKMGWK
jgi:hypothetical protein